MKVRMSPLVAGLSGRAADAVAASWKGIQYVREFVVPANPRSAAQIAQRNKNTYKVWMPQQWTTKWKDAWTEFVAGQALSEFNGFSTFNKLDPFADPGVLASPFNVDVALPTPISWTTGVAGSSIVLDWTDPSIAGSFVIYAIILKFTNPVTRMTRDDWPVPADFIVGEETAVTETKEIVMAQSATPYHCYAALWDPTVMAKKATGIKGVSKALHTLVTSAV